MACHSFMRIMVMVFYAAIVVVPTQASADWTPLIERLVADNLDERTVRGIFAQPGIRFDPDIMSCKLKELINKRFKKEPDAAAARKYREAYLRFLRPEAIAGARAYAEKNSVTLQKITDAYCVPKEIVVSILLVETDLGKNLGTRGAFNTLASMTGLMVN